MSTPKPLPPREPGKISYSLDDYETVLGWDPAQHIPRTPTPTEEENVRTLYRSVRDADQDASAWLGVLNKRESLAEADARRAGLIEAPDLEGEDLARLRQLANGLHHLYRSWGEFMRYWDQRGYRRAARPH